MFHTYFENVSSFTLIHLVQVHTSELLTLLSHLLSEKFVHHVISFIPMEKLDVGSDADY
jgi:hypothetical protein